MASLHVDHQEGHSDKHVANYVLDSSMASLILDGELWGRCPSSLVGHKVELQAALFGNEGRKLSELPQATGYLPRATNAYSWAKGVVEQAADMDVLFITPTVRNELMRAPQVSNAVWYNMYTVFKAYIWPWHSLLQHRKQDWLDFCEVGIVELVGQHYRLIKAHHIERVIESLKTELSIVLSDGTFPESEDEERILIDRTLDNLSSDAIVGDLRNDIKIYMEATIARVKSRAISKGPEITDDHTFFKVFLPAAPRRRQSSWTRWR